MHYISCTKGIAIKNFIPGIAWFLLVLLLICIPGKDLPKSEFFEILSFDKMIHVALFGGIVFLFCMPFKKTDKSQKDRTVLYLKIAVATCIWGITTELIQKYFVIGRQFDWYDWLADSIGAIAAYLVSLFFFARKKTV